MNDDRLPNGINEDDLNLTVEEFNRRRLERDRDADRFLNRTVREHLNRTVDEVKSDNAAADRIMDKARLHLIGQFVCFGGLALLFHYVGLNALAVVFFVVGFAWVGVFAYAQEKIERAAKEDLERAERLERERDEQNRKKEED